LTELGANAPAGWINNESLANDALSAEKISDNSITDAKIASGAFTAAKFAAGAFDAVWSVAARTLTAISDSSGVTTLLSRIVGTLATGTHNPQSGDSFARLGAPVGASISADIATRLASAGYTAPDNATIVAIAAEVAKVPRGTDPIPAGPARMEVSDGATITGGQAATVEYKAIP
jgi:hypothetical protein